MNARSPEVQKSWNLVKSAGAGRFKDVKKAIEDGADLGGPGEEALLLATELNYPEIVEILLKHKVKANSRDNLPLLSAAQNGNTKIVKLLVERGADPDREKLQLAQKRATYHGHSDTAHYLNSLILEYIFD